MLRLISSFLPVSISLGSAIGYVAQKNPNNASLGKFKLFNSALPIVRQSLDISTITPNTNNELEIDFPSDASTILNLTIQSVSYKPSKTPDDLQAGEYKLDFDRLKIIVKLFS